MVVSPASVSVVQQLSRVHPAVMVGVSTSHWPMGVALADVDVLLPIARAAVAMVTNGTPRGTNVPTADVVHLTHAQFLIAPATVTMVPSTSPLKTSVAIVDAEVKFVLL